MMSDKMTNSAKVVDIKEKNGAIDTKAAPTTRFESVPTTCIETVLGDPNTAIRLSFQIKVF